MMQEKQLGQIRPANTTATSLYSPPASTTTIIKSIVITNTTSSKTEFSLFIDDDGTTYDDDSVLYSTVEILGNSTVQIDTYWPMNNASGNLAVKTETADAINFTAFGVEIT